MFSCNKTFESYTGFKQSQIEGQHIFLDVFKKLPVYTVDDITYTVKQGKIWQGNTNLPHPSKENSWYHSTIIPAQDEEGNQIGYNVMVAIGKSQSDLISESNTSESWLKAVFNDPEEANILINANGEIIEFNKAAFHFTEWYLQKPLSVDTNISEYFKSDFKKTLDALFNKTESGNRQKFCRKFNNHSGYSKIFDIEIRPVFSTDMNTMGYVIVIIDITAKVSMEKRIKKSEKRLSDIAFINAHEVRAPLASIMGLLHLLDYEDVNDEGSQCHYCNYL